MKKLLLLLFILLFPVSILADTQHESYTATNEDLGVGCYGVNYRSQIFETTAGYDIGSISVSMGKDAGASGDVYAEIYAVDTDTGKPTSTALVSGHTAASNFDTYPNTSVVKITLDNTYTLSGSTHYALVVRAVMTSGGMNLFGSDPKDYADKFFISNNNGSSWTEYDRTLYFINWEITGGGGTTTELDYSYILAIILLGVFLVILVDFIRRLAMGI